MKSLFLAVAVLVTVPVFAQSRAIGVQVVAGNTDPVSRDIANRLSGKIGATSRYALVSGTSTVILLSANCLPNVVNERQVGITCSSSLDFWPIDGIPLTDSLAGYIVAGDEAYVAEHLFDSFIKNTSDEKLDATRKDFKVGLNVAIAIFPHGVN